MVLLTRFCLTLMGFGLALTGEAEKTPPPLVIKYSAESHEWIKDAPIRTLFLVALDSAADDYIQMKRAIEDSASVYQNDVLHVLVPETEKSPLKRYFGGVDYRPAFFMVNRSTGAYARPHAAFERAERQDWSATVSSFMTGYFDERDEAAKQKKLEATSDVLSLTDESFDAALAKHPLLIVEFYAPWCPHCKKAAPHMEKAATDMLTATPSFPLAKVDVTSATTLKKRFGIESFPQFRAFRKGKLVSGAQLDGEPTSSSIIKFVRLMAKTPVVVPTDDALRALEQKHAHGVVVVAFLGAFTSSDMNKQAGSAQSSATENDAVQARQHAALFADAAAGNDHVFVRATAAASAARHSVARPALLVLNQGRVLNVPFEWPDAAHGEGIGADGAALSAAVEQAVWPAVAKFTRDPLQRRAVMTHPVKDMLLAVLDKDDFAFDSVYDALSASAEANRHRILHFWVDSRDKFLLRKLRVSESSIPTVIALNPQKRNHPQRMEADTEITEDSLLSFVDAYFTKSSAAEPHSEL